MRNFILVFALFFFCQPLEAHADTSQTRAFMAAGKIADAPVGFVEMCRRSITSCGGKERDAETETLAAIAAERQCGTTVAVEAAGPWFQQGTFGPGVEGDTTRFSTTQTDQLFPPQCLATGAIKAGSNGKSGAPRDADTATSEQLPTKAHFRDAADPYDSHPHGKQARLLRRINRQVNDSTYEISDEALFRLSDYWRRAGAGREPIGDCEDIAIEKRLRLIDAGFPPEDLRLAVVYTQRAGLHAVLVARLPMGDYVLDNLSGSITRWDKTSYNWVRVESASDPLVWTLPA